MQVVINVREIESVHDITEVKLLPEDVLTTFEDKCVRRVNLDKAATLTKGKDIKAVLVLKTLYGYKKIETKVLGVDNKYVWIENKKLVPIQAIYAVDIN